MAKNKLKELSLVRRAVLILICIIYILPYMDDRNFPET